MLLGPAAKGREDPSVLQRTAQKESIKFVGNISVIIAALGKIGRQHLSKGELFTPPRNWVNLQITAQF